MRLRFASPNLFTASLALFNFREPAPALFCDALPVARELIANSARQEDPRDRT